MKHEYTHPTSTMLALAPCSMLAASFAPNNEHETIEQYSAEKQFNVDFEDADEWEW